MSLKSREMTYLQRLTVCHFSTGNSRHIRVSAKASGCQGVIQLPIVEWIFWYWQIFDLALLWLSALGRILQSNFRLCKSLLTSAGHWMDWFTFNSSKEAPALGALRTTSRINFVYFSKKVLFTRFFQFGCTWRVVLTRLLQVSPWA